MAQGGPITLTQQQFLQRRPGGNYQNYLSFVANRRGVPVSSLEQSLQSSPAAMGSSGSALANAAVADPANAYANLLGYKPLTQAQIEAQAQGEIAPIISAITGQANSQAATEAAQIQALTQEYANELGQTNFASPYQQAIPQQAAVDAALQQSLTGAGSSEAAGLANRLGALQGSSGAAALQNAGGSLASLGASNGTTQLASGSAALNSLISNEAAAANFGLKLPAIAKLSGLQALGENSAQLQQNVNNAVLQAETQVPSIVQNLTANNETALSNAVAAQQAQQSLADTNYWKGISAQQAQQRNDVSAARLTLDAKKFAQQTVNQDRNYGLALTRVGIQQKSLQLRAATLDYKLQNGGFTPSQVAKFQGELQQGLSTIPAGASYSDFVKQAVSKGIPLSLAINAANAHWPATQRPAPGDIASIVGATQNDVNATGFGQQSQDYAKTIGATAPQSYAISQLGKFGWNTPSESAALNQLVTEESGWDPTAWNNPTTGKPDHWTAKVPPPQGAFGIGQALGHKLPADYATNYKTQVDWMLNYIRQRYGSPSAALAFHQQHGYY